jgi:uncharacterized protein YecA (UPF0149 family)
MPDLAHRWSLGKAWKLNDEQAQAIADGADPDSVGAELVVNYVTCMDCHVEYSQSSGRACVKRPVPIARNHPCPCGSGRKYKRCCARSH